MKEKKHYSAEFKVKVIREHIENRASIGKLSKQYSMSEIIFYKPFGTLYTEQ